MVAATLVNKNGLLCMIFLTPTGYVLRVSAPVQSEKHGQQETKYHKFHQAVIAASVAQLP